MFLYHNTHLLDIFLFFINLLFIYRELTSFMARNDFFKIVYMVIIVARCAKDFKGKVPYDRGSSVEGKNSIIGKYDRIRKYDRIEDN